MKNHILKFIFIFQVVMLLLSCEKMEDTYSEFIKDGEIVYVGRADSILIRGGYNRAEISWLLMSDPKIKSYKIFWNNNRDSVENEVVKTAGIDTVRVMLNDMREDVHNFIIYTYDKNGNSSVAANAVGRVYGENYIASLLQRPYKSVSRKNDDLIVTWSEAENTLLFVEVSYVDNSNNQVVQRVPGYVEKDTLKNFNPGGSFNYRSAFLPDSTAIDTFYTNISIIEEELK